MGLSSKQVSSDGNGWNQALLEGPRTLEFPKTSPINKIQQQDQQQQQQHPEQLNCPRCDSTNTKFCYYNNYNKSQPRHFCKACKRHWTKGGTLRNVPVGGGRKNKRLKISKPASKTTTTTTTNTNMGGTLHSQHIRDSLPLGGSFANNNNSNNIVIEDKSFSEAFYHNFLKQQHRSLPESSITFTSKGLNDGIYLDSTTMKTTSLGLSTQHHEHQDKIQLFPYTNLLGSFDSSNNNNNTCSISTTNTSIQSPSVYNFTNDDHGNNDGLLESEYHQHHPWTMHTSSTKNNNINVNNNISNNNININNNVVDMMSSNWPGLDDFDKFVTVEADLTMPWDYEDIKP